MADKIGRRINIIGTSGSGKTTLAAQLAERLDCTHVELDALNWEANWTMAPTDIFRQRVADALQGDCWTVDGNYSRTRDVIWARSDTVIWLDYSLPRIYWQLTRRTFRRIFLREELWNGNKERFWVQFTSRDSIFYWVWTTYKRRRREYPLLLAKEENGHLTAVILKSPRQTKKWLASIRR